MTIKKTFTAMVAAATLATGFSAAPAMAHGGYDYGYSRYDDRYDDYRDRRGYGYRGDRGYRRDRGYRCEKGTGGTIIGGVVGGLAGREIARRGNRTEGTIIGAAVGALAGRAIDKADSNCRRRYR
ncbi:MAG: glycine zipper 2TM domain-containing protein [Sphingorhabdus sp.]